MAPALLFRSTGLDLLRHLKVSVLAPIDLSAYAANTMNLKRMQAISLGFLRFARADGDEILPLVRIDLRKGKDLSYRQEIGRVVYEAMIAVDVGVPANARFQVVSEQHADNFLFDPKNPLCQIFTAAREHTSRGGSACNRDDSASRV
jgi:hypothetical protein